MRLMLVLLVALAGCVTQSPRRGTQWRLQGGPVQVDFEEPTPRQAEQLRQRGIQLPRSSQGLADLRAHRDFVDLRVTAVGFGLTAGGYLLYCEGVELPVLVPESHVDLGLTGVTPLNASIYPDRATALAELTASASGAGHAGYAYYRGAGGALIVPTLFSPATTPRIVRTMLAVRKHLSDTTQRDLKVLLLNLTGTRVLQGVFSRVVRVSSESAARPHARGEGHGVEAPAPRQPEGRPAAPAPAPAPAPGAFAPSPGLVQALTRNNPTRPAVAVPRLPQDVAVRPAAPGVKPLERPVGNRATQNAQVQMDIKYLRTIGARNIRVNQQQLKLDNSQRVGVNRPDLQFDYKGRRYHVEYDTPASGRGPAHQSRITSNDPDAEVILLIVP
ncbi:hypothetical protein P2318_05995 [Myxococcaceae bacterium GXIMD 01537]